MRKLEKIVTEITDDDFAALENSLQKNSAGKFLSLLRMYRDKTPGEKMQEKLGVSTGALYALRSRLYDRIQAYLSSAIVCGSDQILTRLHEMHEVIHSRPRPISVAYLLKLEEDLRRLDMHNELVLVYSALKKVHLFTDAHFHYSQLYNQHIAYNLSVEKSEEILGSFNRMLRQYDLSRDPDQLETLFFLQQEISQHFALHQSRQIRIIKDLIDAQIAIFCNSGKAANPGVTELLQHCLDLLEELPAESPLKPWKPSVEFLFFEFCLRQEQYSQAEEWYRKLLPARQFVMLHAHVAATSFLPVSEQILLQNYSSKKDLSPETPEELKSDPTDIHAVLMLQLASAIKLFRNRNVREAATTLNNILNTHGLKDAFHVSLEIRLTLVFMYLHLREYEMAASLLRNLSRKTKTDHPEYTNAIHLFNLFNAAIKKKGKIDSGDAEQFLLFEARNNGRTQLMRPLLSEMKNVFTR